MTLELGKNNFEGIFGEILIINKKINEEKINHLYNLKENYADFLCSFNYRHDLTLKNKKYSKLNEEITFLYNLKFKFLLKIMTNQIHSILNDGTSVEIKPYGELKYLNKNKSSNKELKIRLYSINYAIINFPYQHGLEYLIFQLHRIISLSHELLNFYLYKTLHFVFEYIKLASSYYIFRKNEANRIKTEVKYTIFVLSLIIVLNTKQRKLQLDEKIRDLILEFSHLYSLKRSAVLQRMNFCILLDDKIFKKGKISNYDKIIDEMLSYINNPENENILFYSEILYKFLTMDDILESKEIKHKKYMQIFSYFINSKKDKKKEIKTMIKGFIRYFVNIKSQKKIYHYLKAIYLDIDSVKKYLKENDEFRNFIVHNYNEVINNFCKYSQYIQILSFL